MNNNFNYLFKFILVGDTNVGKSALLLQFVYQRFQGEYDATIGVEFGSKYITINNRVIKLQIWDTAGQESFRSITRSYYKGSIAAILVYDVTKRESFENLRDWLKETHTYANDKTILILIGNKSDLKEKRIVTYEEGESFARENNCLFIETSAKNGENIEKAFFITTSKILEKIDSGEINPITDNFGVKMGSQIVINEDEAIPLIYDNKRKKKCCCM